jgi:hypothetical protein
MGEIQMNSRHLSKVTMLIAVALALTLSRTTPLAVSQASGVSFAPVFSYSTGGFYPESIAVADLNGDGKPDLIVANYGVSSERGNVGVLLGDGDGTFKSAVTYASGGYGAFSVAARDVNGDGKLDIIVTNECGNDANCSDEPGTVGVLLGKGDGTFRAAITYDSGGVSPRSVAIADLNADGKPDIIVANLCGTANCHGTVGVLLGNGDGTFRPAVTYDTGGEFASSVAVADVNGDGKPDLIVADEYRSYFAEGDGAVGVLLGNGDGTFQTAATYLSDGGFTSSAAVADVNGDGKPDLISASPCSSDVCANDGVVDVMLGNGDGTFRVTADIYSPSGIHPQWVAVADLNGDGKPDLVVSYGVLPSNGDGTFRPAVSYDAGGSALSATVADVNGDGKPDLLVVNGSSTVGVLINTSPFPPAVKVSASPTTLWPPNGALVPVTVSGAMTDRGAGVDGSSAEYAVQDEYGQVQPSGPIILGSGGKYSTTVWLQASRNGGDMGGRKYTITVSCKDNSGNLGSASTVVTVAHDQRH